MIKVENLSYEFPQKELYKEVSFTLADQDHCAFIGTNGTGKTTLIEMLIGEKDFIYDGIPNYITFYTIAIGYSHH